MSYDTPPDWIGYQMGPTRDYHNEIRAERDALRADLELFESLIVSAIGGTDYVDPPDGGDVPLPEQVQRMRAERDALRAEVEQLRDSRIRHLETETKLVAEVERLTRERDEARNAAAAYRAWDFPKDIQDVTVKLETAERKLAMAMEALVKIEKDRDNRWKSQVARATLAALEKNDE